MPKNRKREAGPAWSSLWAMLDRLHLTIQVFEGFEAFGTLMLSPDFFTGLKTAVVLVFLTSTARHVFRAKHANRSIEKKPEQAVIRNSINGRNKTVAGTIHGDIHVHYTNINIVIPPLQAPEPDASIALFAKENDSSAEKAPGNADYEVDEQRDRTVLIISDEAKSRVRRLHKKPPWETDGDEQSMGC